MNIMYRCPKCNGDLDIEEDVTIDTIYQQDYNYIIDGLYCPRCEQEVVIEIDFNINIKEA